MSGLASGSYKHGRYSKALPAQLAQRYEEARSNPRLLSLSDDIALAEARLAELLGQVETGASGALWQELQATLEAFSRALTSGSMAGMNQAFATLRQLVQQGNQTAATWEEIRRVWETRARLIHTETKTLLGMQQMITVQQHMLMLGAVTDVLVKAVQAYAPDANGRKILREVQDGLTRLATLEGPTR